MTKKDGFILVGKYDEFPRGKGICLEIDNNKYALFRSGNRIGAIANTCIHMDGPLSEGYLDDGYVRCPFHGWSYDLFTGKGPNRFKGEETFGYRLNLDQNQIFKKKKKITPIITWKNGQGDMMILNPHLKFSNI